MILRIWKSRYNPEVREDLRQFLRELGLPLTRSQIGCLGYYCAWRGTDEYATVSIWRNAEFIANMEQSLSYQQILQKSISKNFFVGDVTQNAYEIGDFHVSPSLISEKL